MCIPAHTALRLRCCCSEKGLSDADVAELQAAVDAAVEENMGMAMIYGLVSAAQEWLTDKVGCCPQYSSGKLPRHSHSATCSWLQPHLRSSGLKKKRCD